MDDEVVSDHYDSSLTVYIQGWDDMVQDHTPHFIHI